MVKQPQVHPPQVYPKGATLKLSFVAAETGQAQTISDISLGHPVAQHSVLAQSNTHSYNYPDSA